MLGLGLGTIREGKIKNIKEKMRKPSRDTIIKRFNILTDRREQHPYLFPNTVDFTLPYGDYSIQYGDKYYYDKIVVERKGSVSELFSASGKERERFERELEKLSKVEVKVVLCEFDYLDIVNKQPPGMLSASSVYGSLAKWNAVYGVPFIFFHNYRNSRAYLWKLFYFYVEHRILGYQ